MSDNLKKTSTNFLKYLISNSLIFIIFKAKNLNLRPHTSYKDLKKYLLKLLNY